MPRLMIKCPETGKPVFTGILTREEVYGTQQFENMSIGPCPHCGKEHVWNKPDAYIEKEEEES